MVNKVAIIFLLFSIIAIIVMLIEDKNKNETIDKEIQPKEEVALPEAESLVALVFEFAAKGQVLNVPFIVGKTGIQEVYELWGESAEKSDLSAAIYEDYPSQNATIGHRAEIVFDIRSISEVIQQIRLKDIETVKGEADVVRYDEVGNLILVYEVGSSYQLKWVIPKPTESEPNPIVDHISVVTDAAEAVVQEIPIISKMTLKEKIGQMIFTGVKGTIYSDETKRLVSSDKVGGLIFYKKNLKDVNETTTLLNAIKKESENEKFPLFLGVDQEGGRISRLPGLSKLPTNKEIGKLNDPSYSYKIGIHLGEEMNAFGFNLDFAPVLDVNSNPKNPVIGDRSFGNDVEIVSDLGIQTMKGIQSQNVISVVKHFPGHGDTAVDSHLELPIMEKSLEDLQKLELIPFKRAIGEGADVVMVAHILLPKIDPEFPSSMSHEIITTILRDQFQFDGVVMTDDMTMNAIMDNYEIGQAAVDAVKAGNDIVLIAHEYANVIKAMNAIEKSVNDGEISVERINESVYRILALKEKYKLSNKEVTTVNILQLNEAVKQLSIK
ncbi:beta-N-acetylhexosaminidase [Psychrobacillus sp. OK032]|uniref:beta-N-acetylhexosaminidase n=1 Tax=Psychrobacillus sp. OK032 TaxID=1884358 RepID=UPI0008AF2FD0|nr:beta-N-acetylhexosaminidase [Psychrobacillus sp. OK032]SES29994.1 beta-N-acetylhexosaminidase [Psychrobacillus sp. OK032]